MSESLERISAQQPVSSRTSRNAACSWVSLASTWPFGSDQTRGSPRPMSRASSPFPFRRRTSPPAETSYLIRMVASRRQFQPDDRAGLFSIARGPKKDGAGKRPSPALRYPRQAARASRERGADGAGESPIWARPNRYCRENLDAGPVHGRYPDAGGDG